MSSTSFRSRFQIMPTRSKGRSKKGGKSKRSPRSERIKTDKLLTSPLTIKKINESDASDSSEAFSSSDDDERWKEAKRAIEDLPPDYWSIQKLIKYVKAGNATATMVALCCLKDYDLTTPLNQLVSRVESCPKLFGKQDNIFFSIFSIFRFSFFAFFICCAQSCCSNKKKSLYVDQNKSSTICFYFISMKFSGLYFI